MAYGLDLTNAANRHLNAAERLHLEQANRAVAAYLFGIAAETALKQLMKQEGILPLPSAQRRDDPFYAHFPELKTLLGDRAGGRFGGRLLKYANDSALLNGWDVAMRYAHSREILSQNFERWREQAKALVAEMGAL